MASTACFLHHHAAISGPTAARSPSQRVAQSPRPNQVVVCKAQKQEAEAHVNGSMSRRLALTVLIGAAAVGSKVSPADAAYGEAGNYFFFFFFSHLDLLYELLTFLILISSFCTSKGGNKDRYKWISNSPETN